MTDTTLKNPLDRLGVLPTMMKWRGDWSETEQYYLNDVVISPESDTAFILTSKTALVGGPEPTSVTSSWTEITPSLNGVVLSLIAGDGIAVANPSDGLWTVSNDGVLEITVPPNRGLNLLGDPKNPTLVNTGPTELRASSGIAIGGTRQIPTITNKGVLSLINGNGISLFPAVGNAVIGNAGAVSLKQGNAGVSIDITDPKNPKIVNEGVLSVTLSTGITNTNAPSTTELILENSGVVSLELVVNGGIAIAEPTPQNFLLELDGPKLTSFFNPPYYAQFDVMGPDQATYVQVVTNTSFSATWNKYLQNPPNADACFVVDLSCFWLVPQDPALIPTAGDKFEIYLANNGNLSGSVYAPSFGGTITFTSSGQAFTPVSIGKLVINITDAHATGNYYGPVSNPYFVILNKCTAQGTNGPFFQTILNPEGVNTFPSVIYYPNGLL